jgi:hypothetical protein
MGDNRRIQAKGGEQMINYDRAQLDLVIQSEKPHEFGMRAKTISGSICARLLRDFLRTRFSSLNFDDGIICNKDRKGDYEKKHLSPQCDIIVYHGLAWERIQDYVLVPLKSVLLAIEVKKWLEPSDLLPPSEYVNKQIEKQKGWLNRPVLLVGFRHDGDKQQLQSGSRADGTYLFSRRTSDYPDYVPDFFEKCLHKGELKKLIEDMDHLVQ